ncbi:hypothetical protein Tco_0512149 [Tanacetum coccineum]
MTVRFATTQAKILEAQSEASKVINTSAERLRGFEKQLERKEDNGLYFVERIWVPAYGSLRTLIMNEVYTTKYLYILEQTRCIMIYETYIGPFEVVERVGPGAYRLRLPQELVDIHDISHVSNLKKCLADINLHVPLEEFKIDDKLHFVEEPMEIIDCEVKKLKRSRIPTVKVHWNSR